MVLLVASTFSARIKLRSQSYHVGSIGYRFEDLQTLKDILNLTHQKKVCLPPILTNDCILKYFQLNPANINITLKLLWTES